MGANQNSLRELGLYPEINPAPLSSNLAKTYSYSKAVGSWNRVRNRSRNMNRSLQEHVRD
jgi:hypothetical protein